MRLTITGYPLPEPLIIEDAPLDDRFLETGWLLTPQQAEQIMVAWAGAPTEPSPAGVSDVRRAWHYSEVGLFVTALYLDGELGLSEWESVYGVGDDGLYNTSDMPFDFEITVTD